MISGKEVPKISIHIKQRYQDESENEAAMDCERDSRQSALTIIIEDRFKFISTRDSSLLEAKIEKARINVLCSGQRYSSRG